LEVLVLETLKIGLEANLTQNVETSQPLEDHAEVERIQKRVRD
jgi:hypothetical protein